MCWSNDFWQQTNSNKQSSRQQTNPNGISGQSSWLGLKDDTLALLYVFSISSFNSSSDIFKSSVSCPSKKNVANRKSSIFSNLAVTLELDGLDLEVHRWC